MPAKVLAFFIVIVPGLCLHRPAWCELPPVRADTNQCSCWFRFFCSGIIDNFKFSLALSYETI